MFAGIVTFLLKTGAGPEFTMAIEMNVIPLLCTHKGFLDQIALDASDGKLGFGISFWDSKENAEAHQRSGFGDVMNVLKSLVAIAFWWGWGESNSRHAV